MSGLSLGVGNGYSFPSRTTTASGGGFDGVDEFEATDGQTSFTLSQPADARKTKHQVVVNGRVLRRDVDYTLAGTALNFNFAMQAQSVVVVYYVVPS
jgi:hypothetical protein